MYCDYFWIGSWVPSKILLSLGYISCDMTASTTSYKEQTKNLTRYFVSSIQFFYTVNIFSKREFGILPKHVNYCSPANLHI